MNALYFILGAGIGGMLTEIGFAWYYIYKGRNEWASCALRAAVYMMFTAAALAAMSTL